MHDSFNPYRNADPKAICHFCTHFGGWRDGGVWCLEFKILCADGAGCAFFSKAAIGDEEPSMNQEK